MLDRLGVDMGAPYHGDYYEPADLARQLAWKDDFAWARNQAIRFATELDANWTLTIDTDERIDFGAFDKPASLHQVLDSVPESQAWMVDSQSGSYEKERFIKLPTQLCWQGRTHEALCGARVGGRPRLSGVRFSEVKKSPEEFHY